MLNISTLLSLCEQIAFVIMGAKNLLEIIA